jgi:hypothetical protein
MPLRRARGALLRIVRRRPSALAIGVALALPAGWIEWSGGSGRWWLDGLSLLCGATGAALIWAAIAGPRPDWVESTINTETAEHAEKR